MLVRGQRPWFQVSLQHSFERFGRNEGNAYSPVVVKRKEKVSKRHSFSEFFSSSPFQIFFWFWLILTCLVLRVLQTSKNTSWHLPVLVLTPTSSFPIDWTCKCFFKNNFLRSSDFFDFSSVSKILAPKILLRRFLCQKSLDLKAGIRRFIL